MVEYSDAVADRICEGLADARSLRSICCESDMPSQASVFRWLADDRYRSFREQYARAREAQADAIVDEMLDIADNATNDWMERQDEDKRGPGYDLNAEHIQRSKLRIDARKWMAGKLRPKVYGDKLDVDMTVTDMAETIAARRLQVAAGYRDAS